jgi:hypothetical protein
LRCFSALHVLLACIALLASNGCPALEFNPRRKHSAQKTQFEDDEKEDDYGVVVFFFIIRNRN